MATATTLIRVADALECTIANRVVGYLPIEKVFVSTLGLSASLLEEPSPVRPELAPRPAADGPLKCDSSPGVVDA
jgi:hypothetical protein